MQIFSPAMLRGTGTSYPPGDRREMALLGNPQGFDWQLRMGGLILSVLPQCFWQHSIAPPFPSPLQQIWGAVLGHAGFPGRG